MDDKIVGYGNLLQKPKLCIEKNHHEKLYVNLG